jgi:thiamine-monophosphate kinase
MPEPRSELERIGAIVRALPRGEGVIVGPGDDAAVLRPADGMDLVVTTDAFVENVHWCDGLLPPEGIGRRLAAANLSDIAAMGALPRWATIARAAPDGADETFLRAIELACAEALAGQGAAIVGGNLVACEGPASFTVTLIGEVERGAALTRSGAREGDALAVTGTPGRAAAVLALALASLPPSLARVPPELAAWYAAPTCRVRAARAMAATGGVHAAIDISDGLSGDLLHLADASDVGARIEVDLFANDPQFALFASKAPNSWAQGPSDDYELLLAIDPARFEACRAAAAAAGAPLTRIGEVLSRSAGQMVRGVDGKDRPLSVRGYDHYA